MDDLEVFPAELRATRGEQAIELSLRDIRILELLHRNAGRVLDRNTIFNHSWGEDYFPNSRTLDQHISQLRKRIEVDPKSPRIIRTVHGAGYRFEKDSDRLPPINDENSDTHRVDVAERFPAAGYFLLDVVPRRNARPGRLPVCSPLFSTTCPFTTTC
jgi:DNA-binding winged helix-turn-helix (wHTH) protein